MSGSRGFRIALLWLLAVTAGAAVAWQWRQRQTLNRHEELCARLLAAVPELELLLAGPGGEGAVEVEPVAPTRGASGYAQNSYWLRWPAGSEGAAPQAQILVKFESRLHGLWPDHEIRLVQLRSLPRNPEMGEFVAGLYRGEEGLVLAAFL